METPSIMKIQAYKYNSTPDNQLPIFFNNNTTINTSTSVMETPQLHNIRSSTPAFTQNLGSNDNNIIPIDISFSSYLKQPHLLDDSEISIFDAQKYFNESNEGPKTRSSSFSQPPVIKNNDTNISRLSSVDGYNRARSIHATPTASSEASWNSQIGLLSNPPGALAVSLRNLPSKSSKSDTQRYSKRGGTSNRTTVCTNWFFRRKCPCSGKKSVQVEELEDVSESKTMSSAPYTKKQIPDHPHTHHNQNNMGQIQETITENFDRGVQENERFHTKVVRQQRFSTSGRPLNDVPVGSFSFPILRNPSLPQQSSLDDPPRESLEVFQPRVEEEQPRRKSGGRGFGFPGSPISRLTAMEDDMASDASSDLFEIESFSTQTTCYPTYRRRDSLDEAQNSLTARRLAASNNIYCNRRSMDEPTTPNSVAQTEYCYEPSEASIDWSVTTAQEFERSSVTNSSISASEVGDAANGRLAWVVNNCIGGDVGRKKGNGEGGERMAAAGGDTGQHGGGLMGPSASTGAGKSPLMSKFMHVSSRGRCR